MRCFGEQPLLALKGRSSIARGVSPGWISGPVIPPSRAPRREGFSLPPSPLVGGGRGGGSGEHPRAVALASATWTPHPNPPPQGGREKETGFLQQGLRTVAPPGQNPQHPETQDVPFSRSPDVLGWLG